MVGLTSVLYWSCTQSLTGQRTISPQNGSCDRNAERVLGKQQVEFFIDWSDSGLIGLFDPIPGLLVLDGSV